MKSSLNGLALIIAAIRAIVKEITYELDKKPMNT